MKKFLSLICLASCISCFADWSKIVNFSGEPQIYSLFNEVATMERGIVRFVTVSALESALNDEPCPYDDVKLDFQPGNDYFTIRIGEEDPGSGEALWQSIQGKMWRKPGGVCLLATYLIDSSPQEEYRYLYFYEYDPPTHTLKSIPIPFEMGYDNSELLYDIKSDGTIDVMRWGEPLCTILWTGDTFSIP